MNDMTALSATGNDRIVPGGNNPPAEKTPFEAIEVVILDLYGEAKNWASDGFEIENDDQDEALDKLDKALLKAGQDADDLRKEEAKPFDDGKAEVQARYNPLIQKDKGKVALARDALSPIRTRWKNRKAAAARAAAEKAAREAEEDRLRAEEAIRASSGDLEAREQAEELLATAKESTKFAAKLDKKATTGLGLRTSYRAELTDLSAAIKHYWPLQKQAFADLVFDIANREAGAGVEIPGFRIIEEKRAI